MKGKSDLTRQEILQIAILTTSIGLIGYAFGMVTILLMLL